MNIFKFKSLLLLALIGLAITQVGCVKEQFDVTPVLVGISNLKENASIAQIKKLQGEIEAPSRFKFDTLTPLTTVKNFWKNLYQTTGDTTLIINGYVTSNDSAGNFYEVFTIQDTSGGIDIKVNASRLYSQYGLKPGQRVLVKLNNLNISWYRGTFQIGSTIVDEGAIKLTGIDINQLSKYVERSGVKKPVEPIELSIKELQNSGFAHVQKLVSIKKVQFWDATKVWALPTVNTNRMVMDCDSSSLIVRTSGYAYFSQNIVPNGNGTLTGVLGRYNNDLQLLIRNEADAKFINPRCGGDLPVPNKTIAQLKTLATSAAVKIMEEVVIEAVVSANDVSGNLFKQLFLQDETGGIEFKVDISSLYNDFPVGTKVLLSCKGLYIGKYREAIQLGGLYNEEIGRLSANMFYPRITKLSEGNEVIPTEVSINGINDSHIGKLIKIQNVQFWDLTKTWAQPGQSTNRMLQDCFGNAVIVRSSGYASFAQKMLPTGNGEIIGVLGRYNSDYQLYIRTESDAKLINPRCNGGSLTPNTTVAQLKLMCTSSLVQITEDVLIEVVVSANDLSGNLYKQLFIQDQTGGIEFKVDISSLYNDFPVGTKLTISCKDMYLGTYGEVVQLGGVFNGAIGRLSASMFYPRVSIVGSEVVNPIPVTIGTLNDSHVGMLVKFPAVQFVSSELGQKWYTGSVTVDRTLEDFWGDRVAVRTSSFASFANNVIPSNSGEFTAILSKYFGVYQLYVRTLNDVQLTQPRISRVTLIDETFTSATLNQPISINNWQSKMVVGARNWIAKDVSGNRCAEISAFNTISEILSTTWLISPQVNLSTISPRYLTFKTQYSNWRDWASLEFFVSTNYDGVDPTLATWTKVEDAYVVKSTDTGGVWVSSGIVNLNAFSGNVHFGFKYVRNGGVATQSNIFKVDDFQVFGKQ
jgi:DNA/RNA endonuclease YhcR with UshA esterase domain